MSLSPCSSHLLQLAVFYWRLGDTEEDALILFQEEVEANSRGQLGPEATSTLTVSGWTFKKFAKFNHLIYKVVCNAVEQDSHRSSFFSLLDPDLDTGGKN